MPAIAILGIFVADATFRAPRQPAMGETILGQGFALGPGGKGSNQAVAAARAGGDARFLTRLGRDTFADMARKVWAEAGVTPHIIEDPDSYTGAAGIFVDPATGENAIIVCPGSAENLSPADLDAQRPLIENAAIFLTQLEQPLAAAKHGLGIARAAGVRTILNPAPAAELPGEMLALCDIVTPNETEAEALTGVRVETLDEARAAAAALRARGAGAALITLGARGVLYDDGTISEYIPAFKVTQVVETTGAGDAFNGTFATALAEGADVLTAARFGCAAASISVTRPGAAASMPTRAEIDAVLAG
ncbi:ribokinase [Oceanibium sediminis]|uniref:ribokinase n=1 Tax=Oceanibium sediminis TaxID=2026339 RepID=UPI000DD4AEAF|nr:ribokinase [Oceanibium sediminis]